jgi:hypothetical protein
MKTIQRFWKHVQFQENGCWFWTGGLAKGYGHFRLTYPNRKIVKAHRYLWERLYGLIPEGLELHHTCENTQCVNPEHLELLNSKEHVMKSPNNITYLQAQQTHCHQGHEFIPENTYTFRGMRHCRECQQIRSLEYEKIRPSRSEYWQKYNEKRREKYKKERQGY